MSAAPLVLDAAGLDALCAARPPDWFRALLAEAHKRGREVVSPTVVCAEIARGRARTAALEAALGRHDHTRGERPAVRLVDTTLDLARQVGAILEAAGSGSDRLVDAHVVAVCVTFGGGLVVTADAGDIIDLADGVPATRVRTAGPG